MPYDGERASKVSHFDIVRNPDVQDFLAQCSVIHAPSDDEAARIVSHFSEFTPDDVARLPKSVLAVDGSLHEAQRDRQFPSTRIGYLKIGLMLVSLEEFASLRSPGEFFVDPFRLSRLQNQADSLTFSLPSSNVKLKDCDTVRESFRVQLNRGLDAEKTCPGGNRDHSLLRTLIFLASQRAGPLHTGNPDQVKLHRCPTCGFDEFPLVVIYGVENRCPSCLSPVYPADCLRLWEAVSEYGGNIEPLTRAMNYIEHLSIVQHVRYLLERSPEALSNLCFFVDGPLACFGNAAWLHAQIMSVVHSAQASLRAKGLAEFLVIGLQKTGQVVEHALSLDRILPAGRYAAIGDEYRGTYIAQRPEGWEKTFGHETYYGQDFIFKTDTEKIFVFALPYPMASKEPIAEFRTAKAETRLYRGLSTALHLIRHFELDLYQNAVIPIALAHRHASISLVPGGRVLDLLTATALRPSGSV
jgi:hypothetical protein